MLLAFFLNAAIDQNCEKHILEKGLEKEVKTKMAAIYKDRGLQQPAYQGALPRGNDGLGLMLLGVTGDQGLTAAQYE
jgi:methylmalonyl-CoA mutase